MAEPEPEPIPWLRKAELAYYGPFRCVVWGVVSIFKKRSPLVFFTLCPAVGRGAQPFQRQCPPGTPSRGKSEGRAPQQTKRGGEGRLTRGRTRARSHPFQTTTLSSSTLSPRRSGQGGGFRDCAPKKKKNLRSPCTTPSPISFIIRYKKHRDNVRALIKNETEVDDYYVEGGVLGHTVTLAAGTKYEARLRVYEETMLDSTRVHCDCCRCIGWHHHPVGGLCSC